MQRPYREAPASPLPISEAVWPTVLTLPCSTSLTEDEQQTVISAVRAGV
jgi:perosamine synthetase